MAGCLALLFCLGLLPEPDPPDPPPPSHQPFGWNQQAFWDQLQQQFLEARAAGCPALAGRIADATNQLHRWLDGLACRVAPPEDPAWTALETNLFRLAAMIAACPDRLGDCFALTVRTRAEVKRQS